MTGIFARERSVAGPGYNRWLVPPAALAVQLCIGQVYAFSVFYGPLSRFIGGTESAPGNWSPIRLGSIFTLAIVVLGLSTAIAGKWLERVGPRAGIFVSACCFGGSFLISSWGVATHQLWLLYLGYGVVGGVGLGLGYIAPISTLIQWFPKQAGLATGISIAGFGGGAMIGAPLSNFLLNHFRTGSSDGVAETFVAMGLIYFAAMTIAAFAIRIPAPGWHPAGSDSSVASRGESSLGPEQAVRTPQFYLLWVVLFVTVVVGIGILGQASEMLRENLQDAATPAAIAGFIGILSIFNMAGRIVWSPVSDYLGRRTTYTILLLLSALLYASVPLLGSNVSLPALVLQYAIMMSLYGACFATIPAYIADCFGTKFVGSIHGRLLTAWSAGVLGSVALSSFREHEIGRGVTLPQASADNMYIMAALLLVSLVCNLMIKPVERAHDLQPEKAEAITEAEASAQGPSVAISPSRGFYRLVGFWLFVGIPLAWGVASTIRDASQLALSWKLAVTLSPLLFGVVICVGFYYLDRSRFTIRGVVGPYFAAVALLFGLFASQMATEVWQKSSRVDALLQTELGALQSAAEIAEGLDAENRTVRTAVQDYLRIKADGARSEAPSTPASTNVSDPLRRLYEVASNKDFFKGNATANAAFYGAVDTIRSSHMQRRKLQGGQLAPEKLFSLLLFGLLTQIAIGFCHAGNPRALAAAVMLFSVTFAAAVGGLELLDDTSPVSNIKVVETGTPG